MSKNSIGGVKSSGFAKPTRAPERPRSQPNSSPRPKSSGVAIHAKQGSKSSR